MRRKWIVSGLSGLALAVSLVIVWQTSGFTFFDKDAKEAKEAQLPIRQVMLFNSGVSYFEREGEVDGNVRIDLAFPNTDINDLLKSIILQDMSGGKISTVNYDSIDPVEKVLHSFSLDLNNNPTYSQILNQARGEKIEIVRQPSGPGDKTIRQTGVIVGIEVRKRPAGKDSVIDVDFLNFNNETGLQSIALDQVQSVRFLNPVIDNEFQRALRVVASSHDTQKKTVSLGFNGKGKRKVRVGYVIEQPIWKTSYRLRIDPDGKIYIQGWAIVENTSDSDWNDVRMVLVSGRPISFKMDLYEPLYIPRPTVEPELFASLRPPVYSGDLSKDSPAKKRPPADKDLASIERLMKEKLSKKDEEMDKKEGKPKEAKEREEESGRDDQSEALKKLEKKKKDTKAAYALNFKQGIESLASASELGEYYQYVIDQRITLPRQKSAMLPIFDQYIDGSKVSIYNPATHAKFPLLGLRLKNSAKSPLNQGPITVYEDGAYAGDTRILDLQPNEERLLSFAVDQAVEVKSEVKQFPSPDMYFKMGEKELTARYQMRETRTYTIKNRAQKDRTVLIEHAIREDWKLVDAKSPAETTRDVYRFQVKVPAGATVTYDVAEDHARVDHQNIQEGQPQRVAGTGIHIKTLTHVSHEKLLGLRIKKGLLLPTYKERESRTCFIQNHSDVDRSFTVDHIVEDGWVRIDERGDAHRGPEIHRFILKVAQGKTAEGHVIEERTEEAKGTLVKELPEEKLLAYLASPVPSADVKAALSKVLDMSSKIAATRKTLEEKEHEFKQLTDDQNRLRKSLETIPPASEHYKKFLDEFVAAETEIKGYQKEIRLLQANLQTQQRQYDTYVAALTVE